MVEAPLDQINRRSSGRRSQTRTETKRGRYIQARPAQGELADIAFDATIRAAAPFQKERRKDDDSQPPSRRGDPYGEPPFFMEPPGGRGVDHAEYGAGSQ